MHLHLSAKMEDAALAISKTWKKAEMHRGMLTFISVDICSHKLQHSAKRLILYAQGSEIEKRTGLDILKNSWLEKLIFYYRIRPSFLSVYPHRLIQSVYRSQVV